MTQIEIFKQEFEKMVDNIPASVDSGASYVIDEVYKILDSLNNTELPDGLEESANEFANQDCVTFISRKKGFIAGAEWQKKRDDLETADLLAIAHLQGMEQQKAKMLEWAVEGTVVELGETYKDLSISASAKALNQVLQSLGLEDGDKVRVIVIKKY